VLRSGSRVGYRRWENEEVGGCIALEIPDSYVRTILLGRVSRRTRNLS